MALKCLEDKYMSTSLLMVLILIIGILIGMGVYHFCFRLSHQEKHLQQQLNETRKAFKEYQLKVSNHLHQSAELVNNLANNFDQLQDHILQASVNLNLDTHKQSILQPDLHAAYPDPIEDTEEAEQVTEFHPRATKPLAVEEKAVQPPRDYV